jgi:hypothetical protein
MPVLGQPPPRCDCLKTLLAQSLIEQCLTRTCAAFFLVGATIPIVEASPLCRSSFMDAGFRSLPTSNLRGSARTSGSCYPQNTSSASTTAQRQRLGQKLESLGLGEPLRESECQSSALPLLPLPVGHSEALRKAGFEIGDSRSEIRDRRFEIGDSRFESRESRGWAG